MKHKRIFGSVNNLFQWVYDLAVLNIYFIIFILRGFVLFGVFPAFVSLLHQCRVLFFENKDISIRENFKAVFKEEFKQANIVGWGLSIFGGVLYLNYKILQVVKHEVPYFMIFSFYTVIFIYIVIALWIFPLISYHHNSIKKHLFSALVLGITNIFNTILILSFTFLLVYGSLSFPAIILFFTGSAFSVLLLLFTKKVISEIKVTDKNSTMYQQEEYLY